MVKLKLKFLFIGVIIGFLISFFIGGSKKNILTAFTTHAIESNDNALMKKNNNIKHDEDLTHFNNSALVVDDVEKPNLLAGHDEDSTSLLGIIELVLSMNDFIINDKQAFLFAKTIVGLDDADKESINDPKKYLNNLLKIIIGNTAPTEETQTQVSFSDSKDGIIDDYYDDNIFTPSSKKIYAAFDMNHYFESSVIAKWTDPNGETIIFNKYGIDPYKNTNYIWLRRNNWMVGKYRVDYYRTSDMKLVGSNSFSIQH